MPIDRPGEHDDRPREHDYQPDSPTRRAPREPDHPVPAEEPANRADVWTEYKKAVDAEYRAYAIDRGCEQVEKMEREVVTPAMKRIETEDPDRHLVGLKHRLKDKERLSEKVTNWMDADPNLTAEQAFLLVKDAIRYTLQYSDDRYTKGIHDDCGRLKAEGFELVELRNSWSNEEYKGVNSRWRIPDSGQLFEVQFHTETSFAAKQETHSAYEKLRDPKSSQIEQEKASQFQREVTARIPYPRGAQEIPDYP